MGETPVLVLGSANGSIRALRAVDGTTLWERRLAHTTSNVTMAQAGSLLIALTADRVIHALRLHDGVKVWGMEVPENTEEPVGPAFRHARQYRHVIADERYAVIQDRRQVLCVEPSSGRVHWRYFSRAQTPQLIGLGRNHVFLFEKNWYGMVDRRAHPDVSAPPITSAAETRALALHDGATSWTTREYSARESNQEGESSLAESDNVVYTMGEHGLYALDGTTCKPRWTQDVLSPGPLGRLALSPEHVVIATTGDVAAHEKRSGARVWVVTAQTESATNLLVGNIVAGTDAVYIAKQELNRPRQIEARDIATGTLRWIWPTVNQLSAMWPTLETLFCGAGGALYTPMQREASSDQIGVCALRASDGQPLWESPERLDVGALLSIDPILAERS